MNGFAVDYLTAPAGGWEGMILIGVGEAGHFLIRSLIRHWDKNRPPFRWIALVDPDHVEPHNPSFRNVMPAGIPPRIKKVFVAAEEIRRLTGWGVSVLRHPPADWREIASRFRGDAYAKRGIVLACPFEEVPDEGRWDGLLPEVLVVEATDRAVMQRIPAVHLHTGLLTHPQPAAAWQIYIGATVVPSEPPHPPAACADLLSEAARLGGEKLAGMIKSGTIQPAFSILSMGGQK